MAPSRILEREHDLEHIAELQGKEVQREPHRRLHPTTYRLLDAHSGRVLATGLTRDEVREHLWRQDLYD
jgi:hypothetical protein